MLDIPYFENLSITVEKMIFFSKQTYTLNREGLEKLGVFKYAKLPISVYHDKYKVVDLL